MRSGAGLYYLNWGGRNFSIRAGRETEMIKQRLSRRGNKISLQQMKEMQAGVVLNDARRRKRDVAESVAATIYSTWRGSMVANSIDATLDGLGLVDVPRPGEREELVTALKHLLEHNGVGVSGLNFFNVPGIDDAATRREILFRHPLRTVESNFNAPSAFGFVPSPLRGPTEYQRMGALKPWTRRHPRPTTSASATAIPSCSSSDKPAAM